MYGNSTETGANQHLEVAFNVCALVDKSISSESEMRIIEILKVEIVQKSNSHTVVLAIVVVCCLYCILVCVSTQRNHGFNQQETGP